MTPLAHSYNGVILEAKNVTMSLGGHVILRDLDLTIRDIVRPGKTQGQVAALLGPSGMGKTTLFRLLSGLDEPDAGTITLTEAHKSVRRGDVGVVAQHYPLFAHRTVHGNLLVAGRQAGLSSAGAETKAQQILARFGLEEEARKFPAVLSGGQRQRVAIAQQFMCSEHFLLMDEPFSGLDPNAVDRVSGFINEIAAADDLNTFIIVTHDIVAALSVADTIWLLGRDRDAAGQPIPGARVQATYDLIERGLTWQEGITTTPEFAETAREIRAAFPKL